MFQRLLVSVESIRDLINGTATFPGKGPEIFLDNHWRDKVLLPVVKMVLTHTQLPDDAIDYIELVGNWGLPWPKNDEPELL